MSLGNFSISQSNPNDQIGGGGCVCSPTKVACDGPYAVFQGCETDSNVSPHVVVSLACAQAFAKRAGSEDALASSADVIDSTAEPILAPAATVADARAENPSFDDDELLDALADEDIPEL